MEASFEKSDCRFIIYGMENPHIGIQIIAVMFSMRENVDHKKGKLQLKCTICVCAVCVCVLCVLSVCG